MKRELLMAILLIVLSPIWGRDFNVLTKDFQPWGSTQFDASTMKITWTDKWQGGGWWLAQDCSEYESVEIEFSEGIRMDIVFMVIYSAKDEKNEKLKSKITIPAGNKKAEIILDLTYKNSIEGIGISTTSPGTILLKSLILKETK